MTYPAPFLRLVVGGTLYTSEQWSFGLSFAGAAGSAPTSVPTAVYDAVAAFVQRAAAPSSNKAPLTFIKLNRIGQDGRYTEQKSVTREVAAGIAGASTANIAPQIAAAVTLDTGNRRGLAAKGRFYVPVPAAAIGTDGRILETDANALRDAAVTMVNSLNAAGIGRLVVASDVGTGAFRAVRSVRVGRVLDTIRSRRTSLPESYSAPVTVAGADSFPAGGLGGGF